MYFPCRLLAKSSRLSDVYRPAKSQTLYEGKDGAINLYIKSEKRIHCSFLRPEIHLFSPIAFPYGLCEY